MGRDNLGHNRDKKRGFHIQAQSKHKDHRGFTRFARTCTCQCKTSFCTTHNYTIASDYRLPPACDGIKMWDSIPRVGIYVTLRSSYIITRQHCLLRTTQAYHIFCICSRSLTCIAKQVCTRSLLSGRVHTFWHSTGADDPDRRYWAYGV